MIVHCVVVLLLLQRDTSFTIWVQTLFEVEFEISLHLKVALITESFRLGLEK